LLVSWGEGTKTGSLGLQATTGEATWTSRFFLVPQWGVPGGKAGTDFLATASASSLVGGLGHYTFDSASNLVADVQFWLDNPGSNFGWILLSQDEPTASTARRFASREGGANAPTLVIEYTVGQTQPLLISQMSLLGDTVTFQFNVAPQQTYVVEFNNAIDTTNWLTLTNIVAQPAATNITVSDSVMLVSNDVLNLFTSASTTMTASLLKVASQLVNYSAIGKLYIYGMVAGLTYNIQSTKSTTITTIDVTGTGTFQGLASAFRKGLDEIRRVRRTANPRLTKVVIPAVPLESAIDAGPLDAILSMRGVVIGGVYKAAIGSRAILHGEVIGREMGMSTWVSFAGTNDRALASGEFVETPDGLKVLLRALRAKGVNIVSIRNHTLGEHPQFVFVRFWGQDSALELAKKIRYVLDTQVGAMAPNPREKI